MALGSALGIVAVGANLLYTHWDRLAGLFDDGATAREAKAMEELAAATAKAADAGTRAAESIPDPQAAARAKPFREAIAELPGGGKGALETAFARRTKGLSPELLNEEMTTTDGRKMTGAQQIREQIAATFGRAMEGDAAAQKQFSEALGPEFRHALWQADPETKAAQRRGEREEQTRWSMAYGDASEVGKTAEEAGAALARLDALAEQLGRDVQNAAISADQYHERLLQVRQRQSEVGDLMRERAEQEHQAAMVKSIKRAQAAAGDEAAQVEAEFDTRIGTAEKTYGSAYGPGLVAAMLRAGARGEDQGAVDERLRKQLEARMEGVDPSTASQAADSILKRARLQAIAQETQAGALRDVFGPAATMNELMGGRGPGRMDIMARQFATMKRPTPTLDIMRRQMARRAGARTRGAVKPAGGKSQAQQRQSQTREILERLGERWAQKADQIINEMRRGITLDLGS
jgi:hypothetical protein